VELCVNCKTQETDVYENGVAICIACSSERDAKSKGHKATYGVHATLLQDLCSATKRTQTAVTAFSAEMGDICSELPHPNSTSYITNTARELAAAHRQLLNAHNQLNDFLERGIVPDDLKAREE
jgi:hypothetical protein